MLTCPVPGAKPEGAGIDSAVAQGAHGYYGWCWAAVAGATMVGE